MHTFKIANINRVNFYCREQTHDEGIANCVFALDEYRLKEIVNEIPAPKVIVDVGGHIGSFAVAATLLWPDASVFSFEPFLDSFMLLKLNTLDYPHIAPYRYALVEQAASKELKFLSPVVNPLVTQDTPNTGGCRVDLNGDVWVPSFGVMDLALMLRGRRIDLLKLDCEGSELEILSGMKKYDQLKKVGMIVGEWHGANMKAFVANVLKDTHKVSFVRDMSQELGLFEAKPL